MVSASLFLSAVSSSPAPPSRRGYPVPPLSGIWCRLLYVVSASCTSTTKRPRPMAPGSRSQASLLYEVLGIGAGVMGQEIKTAYLRLAKILHSDVAVPAGTGAMATGREFMRVHEAYATLSDPDWQADYDRTPFQGLGRFAVSVATTAVAARGPSWQWETDQCR